MKVLRAAEMGMCFGVRDALQLAERVERPNDVTIHGELVHNSTVIQRLDEAGFRQSPESDRGVADTGTLVQGHAGVLDRIDSICFAAPVFFHLTRYFYTV